MENKSLADESSIQFYLTKRSLERANNGNHPMFNAVQDFGRDLGITVSATRMSGRDRASRTQQKTLVHMATPIGQNGLVFRRLYAGPFWHIDLVSARWFWRNAKAEFRPDDVPDVAAREFFEHWREALYPKAQDGTERGDFIYMPLQGKLLEHRSFQKMSPVDMIHQTLAHSDLPIRATLHPNEDYTEKELRTLDDLQQENPRFTCEALSMEDALAGCRYIVTENSSAALHGVLFQKPTILFAAVDFHHICHNVSRLGVKGAFEAVAQDKKPFENFLYWYWGMNALNLESPTINQDLHHVFSQLGWEF